LSGERKEKTMQDFETAQERARKLRAREPYRGQTGYGEGGYYNQIEKWKISEPHTGKGPRGYHHSDEGILEEICDRLMKRLNQRGQLDARQIQVRVENGQVTLEGRVQSRHARHIAEETAAAVPGVIDIHNHLHILQH
jgi:osmotically-inducible protein OsmY